MDYDSLERLVKLRDSGALTPEEFAEQRVLLISSDSRRSVIKPPKPRYERWRSSLSKPAMVIIFSIAATLTYFNRSDLFYLIGIKSSEQIQCEISIKANLIDPEAVQFFKFKEESLDEHMSNYENYLRKKLSESGAGYGLSGMLAEAMSASEQALVSKAVNQQRELLENNNFQFYNFKLKSENAIGNTISSINHCVVAENFCNCI